MGVQSTLDALYKISSQLAIKLCRKAIDDAYDETQMQVIDFLYQKAPEELILNFAGFNHQSKEYLKKRYNLRSLARKLLVEATKEERENIYTYFGFAPTMEDCKVLCLGTGDNNRDISDHCAKVLSQFAEEVMRDIDKYTTLHYQELLELCTSIIEKFETFKDRTWIKVILLLNPSDTIKFLKASLVSTDSQLGKHFTDELISLQKSENKAEIMFLMLVDGYTYLLDTFRKIIRHLDAVSAGLLLLKISNRDDSYELLSKIERDDIAMLVESSPSMNLRTAVSLCLFLRSQDNVHELYALIVQKLSSNFWQQALTLIPMSNMPKITVASLAANRIDIVERILPLAEYNFNKMEDKLEFLSMLRLKAPKSLHAAINKIIDARIAKNMLQKLNNEFDIISPEDRKAMLVTMNELNPNIGQDIVEGLSSPVPDTRFQTLRIISMCPGIIDVDIRAHSEKLLADRDPKIIAVALTLLKWNDIDIKTLERLVKHNDKRVRANLIETIESSHNPIYVPLLKALLSDTSNRVRANAAKALYALNEKDLALQYLQKMLAHTHELERLSAYWALASIKSDDAVNAILQNLRLEPSDRVKKRVLSFLKHPG